LAQTDDYSCGPLTIVKFVDSLFRLNKQRDVKFIGTRARQRLIEEKWNVLGKSIPFQFEIESATTSNISDLSWKQAWHQKGEDGSVLVTDKDCLDYVTMTLVKSWTDMVADKELHGVITTKNTFMVKEWIKEWEIDKDHIASIKELAINFSSRNKGMQKEEDNPNKVIPASKAAMLVADGVNMQVPDANARKQVKQLIKIADVEVDVNMNNVAGGMNRQEPIDADSAAQVQQIIKIGDVEVDVNIYFTWCSFPPSAVVPHHQFINTVDLREAFDNLDLLQSLLPLRNEESPAVPIPEQILKGEVTVERRWRASHYRGKHWLNTGEIAAGLAMLMADKRYSEDVGIIPPTYNLLLIQGEKTERAYQKCFEDANVTAQEVKVLKKAYLDAYNVVLENVIEPQPDLFFKKILIFVMNVRDNHWVVTFVFNAECIPNAESNNVGSDTDRRCCFFRYCGKDSQGTTTITHDHGIKWFLNLLISKTMYAKKKELDPNAKMKWLTAFGSVDERMSTQELLQGTPSFPSVTFEDHKQTLPKQSDDHCCGVAAIAVVAILLRDFFDQGEDKETFETIFSKSNTEVLFQHEEHMVTIKKGYLKHLPKVQRNSDYLRVLKGQLYQFYDNSITKISRGIHFAACLSVFLVKPLCQVIQFGLKSRWYVF
jgi:hypothetical protein